MASEHKRPLLAFFAVAAVAVLLMAQLARTEAVRGWVQHEVAGVVVGAVLETLPVEATALSPKTESPKDAKPRGPGTRERPGTGPRTAGPVPEQAARAEAQGRHRAPRPGPARARTPERADRGQATAHVRAKAQEAVRHADRVKGEAQDRAKGHAKGHGRTVLGPAGGQSRVTPGARSDGAASSGPGRGQAKAHGHTKSHGKAKGHAKAQHGKAKGHAKHGKARGHR